MTQLTFILFLDVDGFKYRKEYFVVIFDGGPAPLPSGHFWRAIKAQPCFSLAVAVDY
jgi:hypothetical protein